MNYMCMTLQWFFFLFLGHDERDNALLNSSERIIGLNESEDMTWQELWAALKPRMQRRLKTLFPFATWTREYKKEYLRGDLTAGLTVGIMLVPQSMAYAMVAGIFLTMA